MQDTNSNQLLGLISLENLKHHLGSFTKYIVIFSFELYFFSVSGSLLFMKALSHFPAWEFLSKKTLLWFFSNRNHSEGLDGNHNYPSYIWKSCGRGKKCNFHCKSIRKEFCFIIAVVFFLADCSSFQFSCILDRTIPSKLEVAPHALGAKCVSGWYPLDCYNY